MTCDDFDEMFGIKEIKDIFEKLKKTATVMGDFNEDAIREGLLNAFTGEQSLHENAKFIAVEEGKILDATNAKDRMEREVIVQIGIMSAATEQYGVYEERKRNLKSERGLKEHEVSLYSQLCIDVEHQKKYAKASKSTVDFLGLQFWGSENSKWEDLKKQGDGLKRDIKEREIEMKGYTDSIEAVGKLMADTINSINVAKEEINLLNGNINTKKEEIKTFTAKKEEYEEKLSQGCREFKLDHKSWKYVAHLMNTIRLLQDLSTQDNMPAFVTSCELTLKKMMENVYQFADCDIDEVQAF